MDIVNECKNPPRGLMKHLKRSLRWIYPVDLDGLHSIKLIDELPSITAISWKWYQEALKAGHWIGGWYTPESKSPAMITLHIHDIYKGIPSFYCWTPVPTIILCSTLAHEVGHHLIAKRGYIFSSTEKFVTRKDEENLAHLYAFNVIKKMREHWYYRMGHWAVKDLADSHYIHGIMDWKAKKYQDAANHWSNAYRLNPEHDLAGYWYWRAKEMCGSTEALADQPLASTQVSKT